MNRILEIALTQYGIKEIAGPDSNPEVVKWFNATDQATANWVTDDTPNCAAFISWVLERAGIQSTRSVTARSYEKWGDLVQDPKPGDLAVYFRESPESWKGHVGIVVRSGDTTDWILGANQNDMVCIKEYDRTKLLCYRRAPQATKSQKIDETLNQVDMNLKERLFSNWKTSLLGLVGVVLMLLVGANVITEDQSSGLEVATNGIIDNVEAIVASVMSVILLFSKD